MSISHPHVKGTYPLIIVHRFDLWFPLFNRLFPLTALLDSLRPRQSASVWPYVAIFVSTEIMEVEADPPPSGSGN